MVGVVFADSGPGVESHRRRTMHVHFTPTSSVLSNVFVIFGFCHFVMDRIIKSAPSVASMAAACLAAIQELLLGEVVEVVVLDEPGGFHGAGGRKGPVGAAGALEFDGGDGTFCAPIEFFAGLDDRDMLKFLRVGILSGPVMSTSHQLLELLLCPVRELIMSDNVGDVFTEVHVMVVDDLVIFVPDVLPQLVVLDSSI